MIELRNGGVTSSEIRRILYKEGFFSRRLPISSDGKINQTKSPDPRDIIAYTIGVFQPKSILRILERVARLEIAGK